MIDDDIKLKRNNWASKLLECLKEEPKRRIVSARLMNQDGTPGTMISYRKDINECPRKFWENENVILPSACIVFRREDWMAITQYDKLPFNNPFGWPSQIPFYVFNAIPPFSTTSPSFYNPQFGVQMTFMPYIPISYPI